jgi:DNA invertase Pin-like site-specific DNA recombinase
MLKHNFDPARPHRYVCYRRVSSDQQNPRSPEQQGDTIEATRQRCGYPWVHVSDYTDVAISGRYVAKRPEFQRMIADIRSGRLCVDLILVDTFERFGRAEELADLRRELFQKHGVLVLTADTQFADPNTVAGKALAAFESIRSTDDTRIKAHNVLRGKRDAARLGHWPGGRPPFGFMLDSVFTERHGRPELDHCRLVPNPESAWIMAKLFTLAATGRGANRLARLCNDDPAVPEKYKPFLATTVDRWLSNPIYCGHLRWEQTCTDIVDDARVSQRNSPEDVLHVPDFCEAIVSREVFDAVQAIRRVRGDRVRRAKEARKLNAGKQIAAPAPGLALTYPLSGLVECAICGRAMVASAGAAYTTTSGTTRRYPTYACPGYMTGVCTNSTRVPETWLRESIINLITSRLLRRQDKE